MYKILLLTDFSAASRHAVCYAQALFADTAVEFCLLNCFRIEHLETPGAMHLLADGRKNAEAAMNQFRQLVQEADQPAHHSYRMLVMLGDPVSAAERLLADEPFDLIVMGATGEHQSEFFGSFTTTMIRRASADVLVVPNTAAIQPLNRIVLATDYHSVHDTHSFRLLRTLASRPHAGLTVVTIEKPNEPHKNVSEPTRQYVLRSLAALQPETYTIHDSNVLNGINTYLNLHKVDLLVTLPHHKSLLDALWGNSVSSSFAHHPRVPLLALFDDPDTDPNADEQESSPDWIPMVTF